MPLCSSRITNEKRPPRRPQGRTVFPWTGRRSFVEIVNTPACVSRAIKHHAVPAEIWSPWYGTERDVAQNDKKAQLVNCIRRGTIAGILLTPHCYTLSTSRRGKPDSGWPVALRHDSCPEGFSSLTGTEREAVSRVNLDIPSVLPRCFPRGDVCSFSNLIHQKGESSSGKESLLPVACARLDGLLVPQYLGTKRATVSTESLPPVNPRIREFGKHQSVMRLFNFDASKHWLSLTHCMSKRHIMGMFVR